MEFREIGSLQTDGFFSQSTLTRVYDVLIFFDRKREALLLREARQRPDNRPVRGMGARLRSRVRHGNRRLPDAGLQQHSRDDETYLFADVDFPALRLDGGLWVGVLVCACKPGYCSHSLFSTASLFVAGTTLCQAVAPVIGSCSAIKKPS